MTATPDTVAGSCTQETELTRLIELRCPDDPAGLVAACRATAQLDRLGRLLEAHQLANETLVLAETTEGATADVTLHALESLARAAARLGRHDEAICAAERLVERTRRRHHWSHPVALAALTCLLGYRLDAGRPVLLVDVESLMARWSAADPEWVDPQHHRAAAVQVRALRTQADVLAQATAFRAVDRLGSAAATGLGILEDLAR